MIIDIIIYFVILSIKINTFLKKNFMNELRKRGSTENSCTCADVRLIVHIREE